MLNALALTQLASWLQVVQTDSKGLPVRGAAGGLIGS